MNPQKILVRGVNWLGDAVMTTPALIRLRERYPDAEISLFLPDKLGALFAGHPAVDRVLMFSGRESLITIRAWLRDEQFDLAVIFPNSPRSALECLLAGIPRRIGYARPLRNWMLTDRVADRPGIPRMRKRTPAEVRARIAAGEKREGYDSAGHQLHHYLHLVAALGCDPSPIQPTLAVAASVVDAFSNRFKLGDDRWFALNPGAEYGVAKRWPAPGFIDAATEITRLSGAGWLVLGGGADRELASSIAARLASNIGPGKVRNLAGQTTLPELCAALRRCALLLTNDTGPMHVAAALGTPVVVPFGSTSYELTGPGLPGSDRNRFVVGEASCAPCFLRECPVDFRCMADVTVARVVDAVLSLVAPAGSVSASVAAVRS